MTVIHTLTVGPGIVLFSRPASTLSPRVINRILSLVGRLTSRNVAVIVIARRVKFTHRINAHVFFVSNNGVRRRNAPRRVFSGPRYPHLGSFLDGIVWMGGDLSEGTIFCSFSQQPVYQCIFNRCPLHTLGALLGWKARTGPRSGTVSTALQLRSAEGH